MCGQGAPSGYIHDMAFTDAEDILCATPNSNWQQPLLSGQFQPAAVAAARRMVL